MWADLSGINCERQKTVMAVLWRGWTGDNDKPVRDDIGLSSDSDRVDEEITKWI